jgi:hypothetical protein
MKIEVKSIGNDKYLLLNGHGRLAYYDQFWKKDWTVETNLGPLQRSQIVLTDDLEITLLRQFKKNVEIICSNSRCDCKGLIRIDKELSNLKSQGY